MKQQPTTAIDDRLLMVVERRSDGLRALLVRRGDRPTILATHSVGRGDYQALYAWADSKRCGDVRFVLPASATIVRQTTLPNAIPSQMLAALRLQAEGMFLGSIPMHRIGLGVLPATGDGDRQGVIIGWPSNQRGLADLELTLKQAKITRFIPEIAAMVVLAGTEVPAVSMHLEDGSIAIAFRAGARGGRGPAGTLVLRATRDAVGEGGGDSDDGSVSAAAWRESLRSTVAETALNAGVEPTRIAALVAATETALLRSGDAVTALEPSFEQTLDNALTIESGVGTDTSDWWRDWAILLASTVAACGAYAELCGLRQEEEGTSTSRLEHLVRRYSDPARALRVCVAAFLVIGVAPIAFAYLRGKVIEWKMPDEAPIFEKGQRDIVGRLQQYEELSKRLPVAKLLGDLACCTPDGIEVESIQLSPSQGLIVRGVAKAKSDASAESLVTEMAGLLDGSQIFARSRPRWDPGDGRGMVKFDIEADIFRPILRFDFPETRDWAKQTLAQRKYGNPKDGEEAGSDDAASESGTANSASSGGASDSAVASPATSAASGAGDGAALDRNANADADRTANANANANENAGGAIAGPARGIARRAGESGNRPNPSAAGDSGTGANGGTPAAMASGAGSGGGPAAAAAANIPVPEPITDEQLAGMTRDQARALLTPLAQARKRKDLEESVQKRLDEDWKRVLEHLKGKS
ncbi:MAG: hypothetical protein QM516_05405 [Limnohabitans sp.]|nr:hypothetical protein [Limnohabitans sp.]